ncbi:MAG TPA: TerB family tellurite resistance protein [Paracoccus sp. (in: a-proteobacteria)]|uniref:TerB family tellurite resistance protein n=1 Tax=uncultured Paracoccus sp. TaxID=189685 RepID=UPI00262C5FA8|nr:TerB family tellurite resistance protein [uncultured Paracoccus sp.]HMQ40768.1 TerB family tellurite resistance protein [Paracoccus sp. (in: a-proteobacteria)]HMR37544.1 TerB family tellurite resistance protein [Paracoccus sp. (in: a-proteobacteria)]
MLDAVPAPAPELPRPRSFWRRIVDRMAAFIGARRPAIPPEKSVAFTIAVIALGAKLAKADGRVDKAEVAAFRRVFTIPRSEEKNAGRVFDLARQDVAGFDAWARRIARMFSPGDPVLENVIEGLIIVATADGAMHTAERDMLDEIAEIFGVPQARLATIIDRHDPDAACPPCKILGLSPDATLEEGRRRWRELIREHHPDRAIAAGLPKEAIRLAETRTRAINDAWQRFRATHEPRTT